jgi:two-component system OmpR family sensor kinase
VSGTTPDALAATIPPESSSGKRLRPLRQRLTIGLAVIVAAVLLLVGVAILAILRSFLLNQVDTQLVRSLSQITHAQLNDQETLEGLPWGTVLIEYGPDGQVATPPLLISRPDEAPTTNNWITQAEVERLAKADAHPTSIDLSVLGEYRIAQAHDLRGLSVTVGLPMSQVNDTLRTLVLVEVIGLVLAMALVAGLGRWLIRRELRPLEEVASTARQVTALPLEAEQSHVPYRVLVTADSQEIGDVADAFNDMLDHVDNSLEARAANEAQLRQFVADASHELRTPLASVRGYAELYRRASGDAERRDSAVSRIESEAARMGVLVDDLLLLARLDQGRPLLQEPVDVARLVADTAADVQVTSLGHPISVDVPSESVYVLGDEHRLQQVFVNLLANAVQHTPDGTRVAIAVHSIGDEVVVEVSDTGPGMSDAIRARAFERFSRAEESRTRRAGSAGGSGLGLSIVAAVVAAHHGTVGLSSSRDGTRARVALPAIAAPDDD